MSDLLDAQLAGVSEAPLDVAAHIAAVSAPDVGGIATFIGTVRNHSPDADGEVVELVYSAHPSAGEVITTIVSEVRAKYPQVRLAATHRIGTLHIGDTAVVVERIHLEWRLDPTSPDRIPEAVRDRRVVVVCNEGYSSSLAAHTLRQLGVDATDLAGGFRAWRDRCLRSAAVTEDLPTTIGAVVTRAAERFGDAEAFVDGDVSLTWVELAAGMKIDWGSSRRRRIRAASGTGSPAIPGYISTVPAPPGRPRTRSQAGPSVVLRPSWPSCDPAGSCSRTTTLGSSRRSTG